MATTPPKDYYQLLGIERNASVAELRSAYRELALKYHPDRNPGDPQAEKRFNLINKAYQVLSDPAKRAAYTDQLIQAENQPQETQPGDTDAIWVIAGLAIIACVIVIGAVTVFGPMLGRYFYPFNPAQPAYNSPLIRYPTRMPRSTPVPANSRTPRPTSTPTLTPTEIVEGPIQNIPVARTPIAAGNQHTCALTSNDGVKCWGDNSHGQLGDGTKTKRLAPVDVNGLGSGVVSITASGFHTCALLTSGGIKCWGSAWAGNSYNTTAADNAIPVDVTGLNNGVVAITAGLNHICALTNRGAVKCWGENEYQQLGDQSIRHTSAVPVYVIGLNSGVVAISAGGFHTCALMNTGNVKCWGENRAGQLGRTDAYGMAALTRDVNGLNNNVVAIAAGGRHTCALLNTGGVKCWGSNEAGELGNGTFGGSWDKTSIPGDVSGLSRGVQAITARSGGACALMDTGLFKCWGRMPGAETNTGSAIPVDVVALDEGAQAITWGLSHTCVLMNIGQAKCWGRNTNGQLGAGTTQESITPMDVVDLSGNTLAPTPWPTASINETPTAEPGPNAVETPTPALNVSVPPLGGRVPLAAREGGTCALTTTGGVKCWGLNDMSQLGDGTTTNHLTPVSVIGLNSGVLAITLGNQYACALIENGGVKCWGRNWYGELGDGTTIDSPIPVDVSGLSNITTISAGAAHTCALTSSGGVKCWGDTEYKQLGKAPSTPTDVEGLSSGVVAIAAGHGHTCALTDIGGVKCWGKNSQGQLGRGATSDANETVGDVDGLKSGVVAIAAGWSHTCALTGSGSVKCWGYNYHGQIGNGERTNIDVAAPVDVIGLNAGVVAIMAGADHNCAVMQNGGLKCWGGTLYAQANRPWDEPVPVDVSILDEPIQALALGGNHLCVLTASNQFKCWGGNYNGQLGNDTTMDSMTFVDVVGLNAVTPTPENTTTSP